MRQEYNKPEIKISFFDSEDIMTESGNPQTGLAEATIQGKSQSWNDAWNPTKIN